MTDFTSAMELNEKILIEETEQEFHVSDEMNTYFHAYQDFLLNTNIDQDHDFPIWGYYWFDLNFNGIPELSVLHDSGGSMGGYFTFYRFDGKQIVPSVIVLFLTFLNLKSTSYFIQFIVYKVTGKMWKIFNRLNHNIL